MQSLKVRSPVAPSAGESPASMAEVSASKAAKRRVKQTAGALTIDLEPPDRRLGVDAECVPRPDREGVTALAQLLVPHRRGAAGEFRHFPLLARSFFRFRPGRNEHALVS